MRQGEHGEDGDGEEPQPALRPDPHRRTETSAPHEAGAEQRPADGQKLPPVEGEPGHERRRAEHADRCCTSDVRNGNRPGEVADRGPNPGESQHAVPGRDQRGVGDRQCDEVPDHAAGAT